MKFNQKLKILMIEKGINNAMLAELMGVDKVTISAWRTAPNIVLRHKNANALILWSEGKITLKDCGIKQ